MRRRSVSGSRIALTLGEDPLDIRGIRNRETRTRTAGRGRFSFLVRTHDRISDPEFLTTVDSVTSGDEGLRVTLRDPSSRYRLAFTMAGTAGGILFTMEAEAPVPVWMVEWKISGLDLSQVIVPALGGQSLSSAMPAGTTLSYKYPFWWNAQFVLGSMRGGGGLWLRTMDDRPAFKLLRIRRDAEGFSFSLGFEADGSARTRQLRASWLLDCYSGSWKVPVNRHREWMVGTFNLVPLERHPFCPGWARQTNFVLELWGMSKERPEPLHTFGQMEHRLKEFARLHDPSRTLVYLPGYAEHGIDSRAPSYEPSPCLGGAAAFRSFLDVAHRLGYRVMAHTNVLAMTYDHPEFSSFRDHQVVDAFGIKQGWGLDIDGDWLAEPYFAYINPGAEAWGSLMERVFRDLLARFPLDAIFLDQTLLAFNVSRGPNFLLGMGEHIRRLQRAFPEILFAGEGFHELVAGALPMAQIHGIDSIAEVHGMEGRARWRNVHPVSTYLFGPYTRFMAHLLTKHPSHPVFRLQEEAYARLGVLPALCLYDNSQPADGPAVRKMIRRARAL